MMPIAPAGTENPFWPTRPPAQAELPAMTFPVAYESAIVEPPTLEPTRPPAELKLQEPGHAPPSQTVTVTLAFDCVINPAWPPGPRVPFWPTSPPAWTPTIANPLTTPLADTPVMVPAFDPARTPTHWEKTLELKPGFALTSALVRFKLLTTPVPGPV